MLGSTLDRFEPSGLAVLAEFTGPDAGMPGPSTQVRADCLNSGPPEPHYSAFATRGRSENGRLICFGELRLERAAGECPACGGGSATDTVPVSQWERWESQRVLGKLRRWGYARGTLCRIE